MDRNSVIAKCEELLAVSALYARPFGEAFEECCTALRSGGVSLSRASISWRLIDPVWFAQQFLWLAASGVSHQRFTHEDAAESDEFLNSPIYYMLTQQVPFLRSDLTDPHQRAEYPILTELFDEGHTEYLLFSVGFQAETARLDIPASGLVLSFCSDCPTGFSEEEKAVLERLRFMLSLTARTALLSETTETLLATYLARGAGRRVLGGQMMRGEGETVTAAIWYCDLRRSTSLCEALGTERYIAFLNDFFAATAGPVEEAGGDILDFIGDAVLAIFPLTDNGVERGRQATLTALSKLEELRHKHADILGPTDSVADVMGLAIDIGDVVYGNIGIPTRLTFSVIGGSVNKVARMERLTKKFHVPVIVTDAIAQGRPAFRPLGSHLLAGVSEPVELFALSDEYVADTIANGPPPVKTPFDVNHPAIVHSQ